MTAWSASRGARCRQRPASEEGWFGLPPRFEVRRGANDVGIFRSLSGAAHERPGGASELTDDSWRNPRVVSSASGSHTRCGEVLRAPRCNGLSGLLIGAPRWTWSLRRPRAPPRASGGLRRAPGSPGVKAPRSPATPMPRSHSDVVLTWCRSPPGKCPRQARSQPPVRKEVVRPHSAGPATGRSDDVELGGVRPRRSSVNQAPSCAQVQISWRLARRG